MTPFRERNPVLIGAIGLLMVGVLAVGAFTVGSIPWFGAGRAYGAAVEDASGLQTGDPVEVAGINVGSVTGIDLAGDHVEVWFRVDRGVVLGTRTGAAIRVGTLLGDKYLRLLPAGPGQLDPDTMIPLSRTEPAYDIVAALGNLTRTTEEIDTDQLSEAFDTLAETFRDSPEEVRASFEGLSRLSHAIASRDAELRRLLDHAESVSKVLDEQRKQTVALVRDGRAILTEIRERRELIHRVLVNTAHLASELTGLVRDNEEQIAPALRHLEEVLEILRRNQRSLERSIEALAPYARILGNIVGSGPWFDAFVYNLVFAGDMLPTAPGAQPSPGTPEGPDASTPPQPPSTGKQR